MTLHNRIVIDPDIMVGKPVIAGTRIPVDLVLGKLAQNVDVDALLHDYPRLTRQDIQAALYYAQGLVNSEDVYPTQ